MADKNENTSRRPRLLLVDDEEGFATVLAKRLTRRKFHVATAHSGAPAFRSEATSR